MVPRRIITIARSDGVILCDRTVNGVSLFGLTAHPIRTGVHPTLDSISVWGFRVTDQDTGIDPIDVPAVTILASQVGVTIRAVWTVVRAHTTLPNRATWVTGLGQSSGKNPMAI
jgi:hypothetical protein